MYVYYKKTAENDKIFKDKNFLERMTEGIRYMQRLSFVSETDEDICDKMKLYFRDKIKEEPKDRGEKYIRILSKEK